MSRVSKSPANEQVLVAIMRDRLDFALYCGRGKVDVETDGDTWHANPKKARQDNVRDNALKTAGWRVLRFTTKQIREEMSAYTLPKIVGNINAVRCTPLLGCYLRQPPRVDVVNESPYRDALRYPRMRSHLADLLANVLLQIGEGQESSGHHGQLPGFALQARRQLLVLEGEHAAFRIVDDHELPRPPDVVGDDERP